MGDSRWLGDASAVHVPAIDSPNNDFTHEVIGGKGDSHNGNSIYAISTTIEKHLHSPAMVYPELANPVQVTCGTAAPWTLGTITEVIPASTIANAIDIHWVHVSSISANGNYILKLYKGASGSEEEIASIPFSRNAVQSQIGSIPTITKIQAPNERISAAVASSTGAANTADIKLQYHPY